MSKPPNKAERKVCYGARDKYFACLDANNEDIYKCLDLRNLVEQNCPKQWVKHFEGNRINKDLLDMQAKQ